MPPQRWRRLTRMSCLRKRILFRDIRDGLRSERRSRARNQNEAHRQGTCIPSGATILAFGGIASFLPFQNQWNAAVFEPSRHGSSLSLKWMNLGLMYYKLS